METSVKRMLWLPIIAVGLTFMVSAGAVTPSIYEVAKLIASDAEEYDYFGISVAAVDEDTVIVGAHSDDDLYDRSGAAYVFTRSNGVWTEQQKLTASDGSYSANFGVSIAADGDTAIIGAWQDNNEQGIHAGAAYVFTRSNGLWTEQQKLTASDAVGWEEFGNSVALDGDTALIGAFQDSEKGTYAGAAYVFTRTNGVWTEQHKFTASDGAPYENFGWSVALDGGTAVIAAYRDDAKGEHSGSAYVFTRSNGVWTEQQKLTASDGTARQEFGFSVALDDDTIMLGAHNDNDKGHSSGAAYVFTRSNGVWTEQQKLTGSDGGDSRHFGTAVFVAGDNALIGSPGFGWGVIFLPAPVEYGPKRLDCVAQMLKGATIWVDASACRALQWSSRAVLMTSGH